MRNIKSDKIKNILFMLAVGGYIFMTAVLFRIAPIVLLKFIAYNAFSIFLPGTAVWLLLKPNFSFSKTAVFCSQYEIINHCIHSWHE